MTAETANKILALTADELYMEFRFLSQAIYKFKYISDERLATLATDGESLFFHAEPVCIAFRDNPRYLTRVYLHSVMHCLFSHVWMKGDKDPYLWQIACDIAVEYNIDNLKNDKLKRPLSLIRHRLYEELDSEGIIVSAPSVYRRLLKNEPKQNELLYREFLADDHAFWPKDDKLTNIQLTTKNEWGNIAKRTLLEQKRSRSSDGENDELLAAQMSITGRKRSYREFLRDFMVMHEEMKTDPDEFDLGFYMYGLSMYKNMPIIEPLETREENRIKDFVIVIDTSYSTSGELVRSFLSETFGILKERDSFFREGRVHLIQADDDIRSDILVTDESEIDRYMNNFELRGLGSTDFRPAFEYVGELMTEGDLENMCGLIYFTDGRGIYPVKQPPYKSAFVFLEEYKDENIPPWAIRYHMGQ